MPSLDLFDRSAHPDGWHDVRAPGGYEWWYFDAEDAATDTQVVAIFMQGFIFHPGYLREYSRFIKNPTRVRPPVAADYPCVYLCVYRGGKIWKQFFTQYANRHFAAARDHCEVSIGSNTLRPGPTGDYQLALTGTPWKLTGRGPRRLDDEMLEANVSFKPHVARPPPPLGERAFLSPDMTGGAHHAWTIAAPRCDVEGTINCGDESIAFRGRGYHDHNYGTAPIGDGLARWTWGRAMFDSGRTVTFHHPEAREPGLPSPERAGDGPALNAAHEASSDETHLVVVDADDTRDVPVTHVVADWSLRSKPAMFLRYPALLDFGPTLRLSEPRVIDPSPFYLRLTMKAESFGERSTAFCEIAYPHRLRWPLLGRMIEMSFDKRRARH